MQVPITMIQVEAHMSPGFLSGANLAAGRRFAAYLVAGFALLPGPVAAEEGGSGHYMPGSMSSFIDSVPPRETFLMRLNVLNYTGSAAKSVAIPIAGRSALGADADSWGYGLTFAWRPAIDLGERWSYAVSATIPYVTMEVSADVDVTAPGGAPRTIKVSDRETGLGDIVLQPLMLNYHVSPDFSMNFRVTAYAPTGGYKVGRLANTGKNFWTVEPTLALMYFGQKNGIEASLFIGADFNEENSGTNYEAGTQGHLDGTLAQHFPLAGGLAGVGVSGYYYEQLSADRGDGATFGDFEAKTVGAGPVLSYVTKAGCNDLVAELKWLHEFDTERRLEGDTVFLKVMYKFY